MSEDKTGGPAFPIPVGFSPEAGTSYCNEGMSLRDWFAGMALQGMLSNQSMIDAANSVAAKKGLSSVECLSGASYDYADAMIKERNK